MVGDGWLDLTMLKGSILVALSRVWRTQERRGLWDWERFIEEEREEGEGREEGRSLR